MNITSDGIYQNPPLSGWGLTICSCWRYGRCVTWYFALLYIQSPCCAVWFALPSFFRCVHFSLVLSLCSLSTSVKAFHHQILTAHLLLLLLLWCSVCSIIIIRAYWTFVIWEGWVIRYRYSRKLVHATSRVKLVQEGIDCLVLFRFGVTA